MLQRITEFSGHSSKKTRLIQEVIDLVQKQNPPGRVLIRDPIHAGSWIEADNGKAMEETRHALASDRETAASPTSPTTQAEVSAQAPPSSFTLKQATNETQAIAPA
jgi:hypothetical protein